MNIIVCHECFSLAVDLSESIQKYFDAQDILIDVEPCTDLNDLNRLLSSETLMLILGVALGAVDGLRIAESIRKDYPLLSILYLADKPILDMCDLCNTRPFGLVDVCQSPTDVTGDVLALVREWCKLLYESPGIFFQYESRGQTQFLRLKDVIFFEKSGHLITPKTMIGMAPPFYCSMYALEEKLKGNSFLKISQSIIINIKHLVSCEKAYCYMSDGACFNISRASRKNVLEKISYYTAIHLIHDQQ